MTDYVTEIDIDILNKDLKKFGIDKEFKEDDMLTYKEYSYWEMVADCRRFFVEELKVDVDLDMLRRYANDTYDTSEEEILRMFRFLVADYLVKKVA